MGKLVGRDYGQTAAGTWFRGTIPSITVIAALAQIYGVRACWLAFNEGDMEAVVGMKVTPTSDAPTRAR